jgi:ribonuclease HIII
MTIKETALKEINNYRVNLLKEKFECTDPVERQYNFEITVSKNKIKNKIQVYFGRKGIKTVIQGSNTSTEFREIQNIISGNFSLVFKEDSEHNYEDYIGTDETGKGDFFGPLVVAGVYVDPKSQLFLADLGVRDSKELNDSQINRIAAEIRRELNDRISVVSINPEKYNLLYKEFKNINKILNWAHSKVIENLLAVHRTDNVIIDQFSKTPIDISLKSGYSKINFVQVPKAEKYIGVAAASIIARSELNKWFDIKNNSGFILPKGASKQVEEAARRIIKIKDVKVLDNLAKLHFKTIKKIFED